ncbi:diguanylate cyclase [Acidovorax sp. Leaf76]|uniref:GGDEF domain-containing protein n=1 Tax=unclassified Acidovorax TaxID=2684926 RepID=UPI000700EDEB|nr:MULTISPECIES: sensor domain-containing diguanylate cyclase [unclassified Acidovorax]KQO25671.1 diguanylate cyclase [Acidovorax sp. Leaf76]KQO29353.1 diguanylate cyclase [Acidovorax sp. Leaf84]KQS25877.1 diguanylate cyclase [Acidovorax sp. Leaf191]
MFLLKKKAAAPPAGPSATDTGEFDAQREKSAIAEMLLKRSAQLILGRGELEIIRGICQAIVEITPHIRLAWTWFGPSDTQTIRPQVFAGPASAYAESLCIERNLLTRIGPAFSALDSGAPAEPFTVSQFSLFGPWRDAARQHGIHHVVALPISSAFNGYSGIFVLYADRDGYFDEVGVSLFATLAELFGSLMTVASERSELQRAAYHDALTGLLNRHALDLIDRRVYRTSLFEPPSSLLMLDMDRFKSINDQHGHSVGDQALQAVARTLQHALRRGDEVVRWGGEEFMVCLPQTPLQDALVVAEKLRKSVAAITDPVPLTVSIGVSEIPCLQHLADAVARADQALLQAKADGRNQVCVLP